MDANYYFGDDATIAKFMGLTFHDNIEVTGYSNTTEPYIVNEKITAWSEHQVLAYKESDCPSHQEQNDIVDECQTPLIRELHYHDRWNWLMSVVEKIEQEYFYNIQIDWCSVEVKPTINSYGSYNEYYHINTKDSKQDCIYAAVLGVIQFLLKNNVESNKSY